MAHEDAIPLPGGIRMRQLIWIRSGRKDCPHRVVARNFFAKKPRLEVMRRVVGLESYDLRAINLYEQAERANFIPRVKPRRYSLLLVLEIEFSPPQSRILSAVAEPSALEMEKLWEKVMQVQAPLFKVVQTRLSAIPLPTAR